MSKTAEETFIEKQLGISVQQGFRLHDLNYRVPTATVEILLREYSTQQNASLKAENEELKQALNDSMSLMKQDLHFRTKNGFTGGLIFLKSQIQTNEELLKKHGH